MEEIKSENWDAAKDGFLQIVSHKGTLSKDAQIELDKIASAQAAIKIVEDEVHLGSYTSARNKLDAVRQWPKSFDRLQRELLAAEQQEFNSLKSRSQSLVNAQNVSALEHLQDELNIFVTRVQDPSVHEAAVQLGAELNKQVLGLSEQRSPDNMAFDRAIKAFQQAKTAGNINRLRTEVLREFEQTVALNGFHHDLAQQYVAKTIPDTISELAHALAGKRKAALAPIQCERQVQVAGPTSDSTPCAQLDPEPPLEWIGTPTVDLPSDPKQSAKLPYTLRLIVFVDTHGNVKRIDKNGPVDQDFFKKARDASRQWRTTEPKLNGKPVNASFPIEIVFQP